jgi:hypothetical protein
VDDEQAAMYSTTLEAGMLGFLNTSWCLRRRFPGSGEERGDSAEVDETAVEDDDGVIIPDGGRETMLSHFLDCAKSRLAVT